MVLCEYKSWTSAVNLLRQTYAKKTQPKIFSSAVFELGPYCRSFSGLRIEWPALLLLTVTFLFGRKNFLFLPYWARECAHRCCIYMGFRASSVSPVPTCFPLWHSSSLLSLPSRWTRTSSCSSRPPAVSSIWTTSRHSVVCQELLIANIVLMDITSYLDGYLNSVSNRTEFPLSGGFYSLNSEHTQWVGQ